jgi:hypothetical protein
MPRMVTRKRIGWPTALIAALAAEFSILQDCIKIEFLMQKMTDGTRH